MKDFFEWVTLAGGCVAALAFVLLVLRYVVNLLFRR